MNKRLVRLLTAVLLSFALAAVNGAAVFGVQMGVLTGENEVVSMIISVVVPTNLDFVIDPFEILSEGGNQIAPADYIFINRTNVPVRVSLDITVSLAEDVNLLRDPGNLDKDAGWSKDKDIFFAVLGADALLIDGDEIRGVYNGAADTLIPLDTESRAASIVFALAPGAEQGDDESDNGVTERNIGAFQFYAELNTYAPWGSGDINVSAAYNISPLRNSTYNGLFESGAFTNGGWGTQLKAVAVKEPENTH